MLRMVDLNRLAARIVSKATDGPEPESPHAQAGRNGGLKGGTARAERMTPEQRSEVARRAAEAPWSNVSAE